MKSKQKFETPVTIDFADLDIVEQVVEKAFVKEPKARAWIKLADLRIDVDGKNSIDLAEELARYLLKIGCAKAVPISDDQTTSSLDFPSINTETMKRIIDESRKWSATKKRTFMESEGKLEKLTLEGTTTKTFHIITISD